VLKQKQVTKQSFLASSNSYPIIICSLIVKSEPSTLSPKTLSLNSDVCHSKTCGRELTWGKDDVLATSFC